MLADAASRRARAARRRRRVLRPPGWRSPAGSTALLLSRAAMTEPALWRRLVAEFLGSAFLAAVVVGSGIAAQQLSPGNTGLQLFENAAATAAGLFAIILMFGPVSGGALQPGGLLRRRRLRRPPLARRGRLPPGPGGRLHRAGRSWRTSCSPGPPSSISTKHRASPAHFLSEVVATLGLAARDLRPGPLGPAHAAPRPRWAPTSARPTSSRSSTSFANPAITVGRMFSNTFAGIAPSSAPSFVGRPGGGRPRRRRPDPRALSQALARARRATSSSPVSDRIRRRNRRIAT